MKQAFQPRLLHSGEKRTDVNAQFRAEASALALQFRCDDCAYVVASIGTCSLGWPNAALHTPTLALLEIVRTDGIPEFCKAFEPDGS
ncbi:MAG: hypothetical protein EXR79_01140 [Myxococcales bacterium]|nr:hypothetical protein [Myxococcales bacterium]